MSITKEVGQNNERNYEYKWLRKHQTSGIKTTLLKRHHLHSTEMEKEIFIWINKRIMLQST